MRGDFGSRAASDRGEYNSPVFDPIGVQPRGLGGRPLIALVFAVLLGFGVGELCFWLHVSQVASYAIVAATLGAVAGVWHWIERPRPK
jgi:hypothetical protein